MRTADAFLFISMVVFLAWACIICPPAGVLGIVLYVTALQAAVNSARRKRKTLERDGE